MKATTMTRPLVAGLAAGAVASALVLVPGAADATVSAKPASKTFFGGESFGSAVGVAGLASSGKSAWVPMCTPKLGATNTDSTAAVALPGLGTIGAVTTRIASAGHHAGVSSTSVSHTAATKLIAGLVQASALNARAQVFKTKSGEYQATATSTLLGLSIAGQKLPSTATPGQTFSLPGLGSVILDQVTQSAHGGNHKISVTALRIELNPSNTLGLPSGNIAIGHAVASIHTASSQQGYGSAFGTKANVLDVVKSGRTSPVTQGCGGSGGYTVKNATAGVNLENAAQVSATHATTVTTQHGSAISSVSRSRIAALNLGGGALKIDAIVARAQVTRDGSKLVRSADGTYLIGITIAGKSFAAPTGPMTQTIPGLATLYFNDVTDTPTGMQVTALRIVLLTAVGGLAQGAQILLGVASAGVRG